MPNTRSAAKRLRQDVSRRSRNRSAIRELRTRIRKVRDAIRAKDPSVADAEFHVAAQKLDRAGAHHLIHQNAAARIKSRLSAQIKAIKQPAGA